MARMTWVAWLNTKLVYSWTVTHSSANRARRRANTLINASALPVSQTDIYGGTVFLIRKHHTFINFISLLLNYLQTISLNYIITCVSYAEARNRYRLDVRPSVRLSVRLFVTRWYCIKTAERIVMISSPHDSPFILVLYVPRSSRNSDGVTPAGALNTGRV